MLLRTFLSSKWKETKPFGNKVNNGERRRMLILTSKQHGVPGSWSQCHRVPKSRRRMLLPSAFSKPLAWGLLSSNLPYPVNLAPSLTPAKRWAHCLSLSFFFFFFLGESGLRKDSKNIYISLLEHEMWKHSFYNLTHCLNCTAKTAEIKS